MNEAGQEILAFAAVTARIPKVDRNGRRRGKMDGDACP